MSPATIVKSRGTVTIDVNTCKGCELCIPACPPKVLTMSTPVNHMGFHYPELHAGCTGCAACLMVCPDFCFEVFRFTTPIETEVQTAEVEGPSGPAPKAPRAGETS